MKTKSNFIIIDDSRMDVFLIDKIIRAAFEGCHVVSFEKPDVAVEYFKTNIPSEQVTVFLDINMPVISGFDFLDIFHTLEPEKKEMYEIFILTSSSNTTDIERGKSNPYVADVVNKPLTKDRLFNL